MWLWESYVSPKYGSITKTDMGTFQVAYLSSYISFNIPVPGWKTHEIQCGKRDPNVLIPNGISNWEVATIDGIERDVLTMTLSAADEDNILMDIHGLKQLSKILLQIRNMATSLTVIWFK